MSFISGINHLGLVVEDIEKARHFFETVLEMEVFGDRGELLLLRAGNSILAIKTPAMAVSQPEHGAESSQVDSVSGWQSLDHYGFFAEGPTMVDQFAERLRSFGIEILKGPYDRSDGRSVYFRDPCGNVGEYLYFSGF
jgi:catechol 2,3-dioxygenase-like lactoylglutathione lyase family enzyme